MNIKPTSKKVIMLTSKHEPESKTLYNKEKSKQKSMTNSVPKRGSVPDVKDQQNHKCGREKKLPTAPVKKIPNVHSVGSLPAGSGGDVQVIWRQLVQEKQRNKIMQFEVERLRKSLEVCKKTVKEKCSEIDSKNKLISKLIEDKTRIESSGDNMEDDIDIDNLLHANLGEVDISELLNITDSPFPADLESLEMPSLVPDLVRLSLSPASLAMATNTSFVVEEEEEEIQLPNREGRVEEEHIGVVKGVVERLVDQRRSFYSVGCKDKQTKKVSPIKIIKGVNQYQLASRKRQQVPLATEHASLCKDSSTAVTSALQQCLSCHHCNKQFPLGGQWKLTRHISSVHSSSMSFLCQNCNKKFSCQSILTAHTEWHQMTSPWQCDECSYRLGNLTQFVKHVQTAHRVTSLVSCRRMLREARE